MNKEEIRKKIKKMQDEGYSDSDIVQETGYHSGERDTFGGVF